MSTSVVPSAMHRVARTTPFRIGTKEIYLPDFVITLKRTRLPSQYATFEVPLSMNKLDMRDYLWHAYSIRTLSITSRVLPNPVQTGRPNIERPQRTLFRPAPIKKMTVLMDKPFVWPAPPSEKVLKDDFNQEQFRAAQKEQEVVREQMQLQDTHVDRLDREAMREQAKRLLEGKDVWRPPTRKEGNWAVLKERLESEATV